MSDAVSVSDRAVAPALPALCEARDSPPFDSHVPAVLITSEGGDEPAGFALAERRGGGLGGRGSSALADSRGRHVGDALSPTHLNHLLDEGILVEVHVGVRIMVGKALA